MGTMRVTLRNPKRLVEVDGPLAVTQLLEHLDIAREAVLVISDDTLVPADAVLGNDSEVEIRPVISGGSA
jgi:sulfur carrier protein